MGTSREQVLSKIEDLMPGYMVQKPVAGFKVRCEPPRIGVFPGGVPRPRARLVCRAD